MPYLLTYVRTYLQHLQIYLLTYIHTYLLTILYHTIPYHSILYYAILYYTILYSTLLYGTILYYTILYCSILYYTVPIHSIPYYTYLLLGLVPYAWMSAEVAVTHQYVKDKLYERTVGASTPRKGQQAVTIIRG
jgi:hypothetical protein